MRRLKLQMQITLDGFVAGPAGEMDFFSWNWDETLNAYVQSLTANVDHIVLGRKLAEGFIPYWSSNANEPGAEFINTTQKTVFTKTIQTSPWAGVALATEDLAEEIKALKAQAGGDLIAYGGANFVSALIANKLIDELNLFINPVAIGRGLPIFEDAGRSQFQLNRTRSFPCGIVAMQYLPVSTDR